MLGIRGLLESRKATLCLIILLLSSVGLFVGKLDGVSYAAVVSTVAIIYNFCQHKVDIANLPSKGTI